MPGLLRTYGFRFALPPREMDLGLIYQALPPYDYETMRRLATEIRPALQGT